MRIQLLLILIFAGTVLSAKDRWVKLWPDGAPSDNGMTQPEEKFNGVWVRNVSEAEMFVVCPENARNSAAVIICPGGGYGMEAMDHEGFNIASWLRDKGIAGIVLKYRLPYGHKDIPSDDLKRAVRLVRSKAEEWGIDPDKVGIAGSSAGGHLASTVGTHFDYGDKNSFDPIERLSSRPDFMLLLYPVITFKESFTHTGSRVNLIGQTNDWNLVQEFSNELHVTPETPPTFLILADDDDAVPPRNSIEFYMALKENNVPAELHIYQEGGHGFGLRDNNLPVDEWPDLFYTWLKAQKIIE